METKKTQPVVIVENHDQVYWEWKKRKFFNQVLVHVDAHFDYEPFRGNKINLGNFLYTAVRDGIVSKIYWVVPGSESDFIADLVYLKKLFNHVLPHKTVSSITFGGKSIKLSLGKTTLTVCTLTTLPTLKAAVLLDIDVDFFVVDRLRNDYPLTNIGGRKQWVSTQKFIRTLLEKLTTVRFTTIAYSVNGGFTPMKYKYLGDQLAWRMGHSDMNLKNRLKAGEYFLKFRAYFEKGAYTSAKKNLFQAIALNKAYLVPDMTYGMLYLRKNDVYNAWREYSRMYKVHPKFSFTLIGLGIVNILQRKFKHAYRYFKKVLKLDHFSKSALLYAAFIALNLNDYSKMIVYLQRYAQLSPRSIWTLYLKAKMYEYHKNHKFAHRLYEQFLRSYRSADIPPGIEILIK